MKTIRKGFDPNPGNQFQQDYSGSVIGLGRSWQKRYCANPAMDEQEQFDQEREDNRVDQPPAIKSQLKKHENPDA